jgi:hypothetical protein
VGFRKMDFEDRVRMALKQHTRDIEVSTDVRNRIVERIEQRRGYRNWLIGTGLAGILLVGANSVVLAATGRSLFDVIVHTNTISQGSGMMSGWVFVPAGGKSPAADQPPSQDTGSRSADETTPRQVKPSHPVEAHAVKITGPIVIGNSFMDIRYDKALSDFLGTDRFPKLNMDNAVVGSVNATVKDKALQQFDLDVTAGIPVGNYRELFRLVLYHDQAGSFLIDGDTTARGNAKREVTLNGQEATYITFTNGHSTLRYLTWSRGPWVILLSGYGSEDTFMRIAENVDKQAQSNG